MSHALLGDARALAPWPSDSAMMDAALDALIKAHRRSEIDAAYEVAYRQQPFGESDAWGDLASFGEAAAAS